MVSYLRDMAQAAAAIADGDLAVEVEPKSPKDALGHAFQSMTSSLGMVVGEIAQTAQTVSAASRQMATTAEGAGRAVGEIAGAITDVTAGAQKQMALVDQSRMTVDATCAAADDARTAAEEGSAAAGRATDAMEGLRESSRAVTEAIRQLGRRSDEIGTIVATITTIAEQTNLLALNAAIEAARAGDHGRGFAVVAEEVRQLAEESQQAAQSIGGLIHQIQGETQQTIALVETAADRTSESVEVVDQTRSAFAHIAQSVTGVSEQIGTITTATSQVAGVAEQSSAAMEEVSATTQETAASAQEVAASAHELARAATELENLIAQFRTA